MQKEFKIGIFDSGIGGLTVYFELIKERNNLNIVYFADQKFMPYGNKSNEEIISRAHLITQFLIDQGCKMVVVACNSATAIAIDTLRENFPHLTFIGIEPFIKYVQQMESRPKGEVALLTTEITAQSERFKKLKYHYDPSDKLTVYPCPGLANFVEDNFLDLITGAKIDQHTDELKSLLSFIPNKIHSQFILGCTHYPYLSDYLHNIFGVDIIAPEKYVANRVFSIIGNKKANSQMSFYSSKIETSYQSSNHFLPPISVKNEWFLFFSKHFN